VNVSAAPSYKTSVGLCQLHLLVRRRRRRCSCALADGATRCLQQRARPDPRPCYWDNGNYRDPGWPHGLVAPLTRLRQDLWRMANQTPAKTPVHTATEHPTITRTAAGPPPSGTSQYMKLDGMRWKMTGAHIIPGARNTSVNMDPGKAPNERPNNKVLPTAPSNIERLTAFTDTRFRSLRPSNV